MNKVRQWVIQVLTSRLLKAVTIDDLLRYENGLVFIGSRQLDKNEIDRLKIEASSLEKTLTWSLIQKNIQWIAFQKMSKGRDQELIAGQMMVYNLEIIREFIEKLKLLR